MGRMLGTSSKKTMKFNPSITGAITAVETFDGELGNIDSNAYTSAFFEIAEEHRNYMASGEYNSWSLCISGVFSAITPLAASPTSILSSMITRSGDAFFAANSFLTVVTTNSGSIGF